MKPSRFLRLYLIGFGWAMFWVVLAGVSGAILWVIAGVIAGATGWRQVSVLGWIVLILLLGNIGAALKIGEKRK